jgi:hypothetical protein
VGSWAWLSTKESRQGARHVQHGGVSSMSRAQPRPTGGERQWGFVSLKARQPRLRHESVHFRSDPFWLASRASLQRLFFFPPRRLSVLSAGKRGPCALCPPN